MTFLVRNLPASNQPNEHLPDVKLGRHIILVQHIDGRVGSTSISKEIGRRAPDLLEVNELMFQCPGLLLKKRPYDIPPDSSNYDAVYRALKPGSKEGLRQQQLIETCLDTKFAEYLKENQTKALVLHVKLDIVFRFGVSISWMFQTLRDKFGFGYMVIFKRSPLRYLLSSQSFNGMRVKNEAVLKRLENKSLSACEKHSGYFDVEPSKMSAWLGIHRGWFREALRMFPPERTLKLTFEADVVGRGVSEIVKDICQMTRTRFTTPEVKGTYKITQSFCGLSDMLDKESIQKVKNAGYEWMAYEFTDTSLSWEKMERLGY
eukprot:m.227811 g.227811  ORF g.227811 m.227811 type:complete len:318 (+) comp26417_c0_seq10:369-1322(+)